MFCNLVAAATSVGVMGQEYSVLVPAANGNPEEAPDAGPLTFTYSMPRQPWFLEQLPHCSSEVSPVPPSTPTKNFVRWSRGTACLQRLPLGWAATMELENALAEAAQGEQGLGWLQGRDLH